MPTHFTNFTVENLLRREESDGRRHVPASGALALRRKRCSFTSMQVHFLEREFHFHRYISAERRRQLAALLGMTQQQVKIWFQNRRYKLKVLANVAIRR